MSGTVHAASRAGEPVRNIVWPIAVYCSQHAAKRRTHMQRRGPVPSPSCHSRRCLAIAHPGTSRWPVAARNRIEIDVSNNCVPHRVGTRCGSESDAAGNCSDGRTSLMLGTRSFTAGAHLPKSGMLQATQHTNRAFRPLPRRCAGQRNTRTAPQNRAHQKDTRSSVEDMAAVPVFQLFGCARSSSAWKQSSKRVSLDISHL